MTKPNLPSSSCWRSWISLFFSVVAALTNPVFNGTRGHNIPVFEFLPASSACVRACPCANINSTYTRWGDVQKSFRPLFEFIQPFFDTIKSFHKFVSIVIPWCYLWHRERHRICECYWSGIVIVRRDDAFGCQF